MNNISAEDKLSLTRLLESTTVATAMLNAVSPIVKDDGLKRIVDASISASEAQIKVIQEFCNSHGLN